MLPHLTHATLTAQTTHAMQPTCAMLPTHACDLCSIWQCYSTLCHVYCHVYCIYCSILCSATTILGNRLLPEYTQSVAANPAVLINYTAYQQAAMQQCTSCRDVCCDCMLQLAGNPRFGWGESTYPPPLDLHAQHAGRSGLTHPSIHTQAMHDNKSCRATPCKVNMHWPIAATGEETHQ